MSKCIMIALVATVLSSSATMAACDALCHKKCAATWQAGGFGSMELCVAKWSKINAQGHAYAVQIEAANRARGWRRE